jgi:hypothetical protein
MKKILFCLSLILLLFACKNKKTSLQDDSTVTVSDFIEFFPEVSLPFYVSDSVLLKKSNDSMVIGKKNFSKFIPDSIYRKDFGKGITPKLYAIGRAVEKKKEKYLFIKAVSGSKRVAYLVCFSKDDQFLKAMPLVRTGIDRSTSAYGLLDTKFQITTYRETRKSSDEIAYKRNVYFYDRNSDLFTLIMTEPNEDIIQDIINPIDTMSSKHKYAGDYVLNKRNIISVRDGKNPSEIQFFVHFEKMNGECTGELKGTARMISKTVAQFAPGGNPCVLEFLFTATRVTMKEKSGCGSYRDIKCFFEGSFPKKKKPVKAPAKSKRVA